MSSPPLTVKIYIKCFFWPSILVLFGLISAWGGLLHAHTAWSLLVFCRWKPVLGHSVKRTEIGIILQTVPLCLLQSNRILAQKHQFWPSNPVKNQPNSLKSCLFFILGFGRFISASITVTQKQNSSTSFTSSSFPPPHLSYASPLHSFSNSLHFPFVLYLSPPHLYLSLFASLYEALARPLSLWYRCIMCAACPVQLAPCLSAQSKGADKARWLSAL